MFDKIKSLLGGKSGNLDLGGLPLGGYEKYLKGATFPLGIDDLIRVLKGNGAPSQLLGAVENLGAKGKTTFSSKEDVMNAVKAEAGNIR